MARKASGKRKSIWKKPACKSRATTPEVRAATSAAQAKKASRPKAESGGQRSVGRDGAVASTAKLLDATALAKMVVSQLEGAVRAVAMSMLRSRDGSLQGKYEQLSLDGQLEILVTVLEQAAEIAEVTALDELDADNQAQVDRAHALLPIFTRLGAAMARLRLELDER